MGKVWGMEGVMVGICSWDLHSYSLGQKGALRDPGEILGLTKGLCWYLIGLAWGETSKILIIPCDPYIYTSFWGLKGTYPRP